VAPIITGLLLLLLLLTDFNTCYLHVGLMSYCPELRPWAGQLFLAGKFVVSRWVPTSAGSFNVLFPHKFEAVIAGKQ
jgi:hypothetical protein